MRLCPGVHAGVTLIPGRVFARISVDLHLLRVCLASGLDREVSAPSVITGKQS